MVLIMGSGWNKINDPPLPSLMQVSVLRSFLPFFFFFLSPLRENTGSLSLAVIVLRSTSIPLCSIHGNLHSEQSPIRWCDKKKSRYRSQQLLSLFPEPRTLCMCDNVLSMRDDSTQPTWRNALFLPGSLLTDALQDSWISSQNRVGIQALCERAAGL